MIKAEVVAHSTCNGNEICTMVVTMPRIILAEFNTHRMFSRNSASSRAIPFEKMVKSVNDNPFIPIAWQIDHKGMQGIEYLTAPIDTAMAHDNWLEASKNAIRLAKNLNNNCHVTKQLCNRLLEPFMYHTVIVTATEWENFFALRCPQYEFGAVGKSFRSKKDYLKESLETFPSLESININENTWKTINKGQAEIHMMALAEAMWDAKNESTPKELKAGEWHIPFGDSIDELKLREYLRSLCKGKFVYNDETVEQAKIEIAIARCARVSYTVVGEEGKEPNYKNDIKLHDSLMVSKHASPFEHCALCTGDNIYSRNFTGGWKQYREIICL